MSVFLMLEAQEQRDQWRRRALAAERALLAARQAGREEIARAVEIAIVERTMHHPVAKHLPKLGWLWPHVADAILALIPPSSEGSGG